jgi:hypothetical protein
MSGRCAVLREPAGAIRQRNDSPEIFIHLDEREFVSNGATPRCQFLNVLIELAVG